MPDSKRTVECPYCKTSKRVESDAAEDYEGTTDMRLEQCGHCTRWFAADWVFPGATCTARGVEGQKLPAKRR